MTAQFHERLILEGTSTSMACCPPIPQPHPDIVRLNDDELHTAIDTGEISMPVLSTACWREYIGTWELKDGHLSLVSISGRYAVTSATPIFAGWFSGLLLIPEGSLIQYVHMGFASTYEFERHITIENGLVVDERRIDNRGNADDASKRSP